ncbi:MAG: hypothetical protein LBS43_02165 [Prevotellaceae bacterium]|jgi:hypothetical protein|nr:hypothetical protein [Prevotellaceae bacterium]
MFIGYLSSFFIALLLSFFYLGYAASGAFERIKKDIKKEIETGITEKIPNTVPAENSFVFDYVADISEPNRQPAFSSGFAVDIPVIDDGIPLRKICLSEYFLRPPPPAL